MTYFWFLKGIEILLLSFVTIFYINKYIISSQPGGRARRGPKSKWLQIGRRRKKEDITVAQNF